MLEVLWSGRSWRSGRTLRTTRPCSTDKPSWRYGPPCEAQQTAGMAALYREAYRCAILRRGDGGMTVGARCRPQPRRRSLQLISANRALPGYGRWRRATAARLPVRSPRSRAPRGERAAPARRPSRRRAVRKKLPQRRSRWGADRARKLGPRSIAASRRRTVPQGPRGPHACPCAHPHTVARARAGSSAAAPPPPRSGLGR